MQTHQDVVLAALAAVLQPAGRPSWTAETHLETELGMDSGLMLELIMQLEEMMPALVIDPANLSYEQFATVGSVAAFVEANLLRDEVA